VKVDAELLRVAAAAAAMPSEQWGKFSGVSGFRYYKKNPQWQVRWSAGGATSWETWDKLDSEPIRTAATAVATAEYLQVIKECLGTEAVVLEEAKEANADGTISNVKDDIVCAIDNLDYLQVIPECRDTEPVTIEEVKQANAEGKISTGEEDIVCAIDNLDYLQVIPECRDTEPVAPEEAKQANADGKISNVKDDIVCAIDNLDY
jgi:hypothetical protein